MKRKLLKDKVDTRSTFVGTVSKFGKKSSYGYTKETVLLTNIHDDTNTYLCDHVWLTSTKSISSDYIRVGDIIKFNARVTTYIRGYFMEHQEVDFKLSHPNKLEVINKQELSIVS